MKGKRRNNFVQRNEKEDIQVQAARVLGIILIAQIEIKKVLIFGSNIFQLLKY